MAAATTTGSPRFIACANRACRTPKRPQTSPTPRPRGPGRGERPGPPCACVQTAGWAPRDAVRAALARAAFCASSSFVQPVHRKNFWAEPLGASSGFLWGRLSRHRNLRHDNSGVNHISNALLSHWVSGILCPVFNSPGTNTDRPVFISKLTSELDVTRREYYVNRAVEFLVASEQTQRPMPPSTEPCWCPMATST